MSYQSDASNHDQRTLLGRVNRVLWDSWIPLDTNNGTLSAPEDEYDSYGPAIVKLLQEQATIEAIALHLSNIQMKRMLLEDTPERNRSVANKLRACVY